MSRVLKTCVSLLSIVGFAKSQPCSEGITTLHVSTTAEALELSDSLNNCAGSGEFEVNWSGNVLLLQTITVQSRTALTVRGVGAEAAVIDGGDAISLFHVFNGSVLMLDGVSLIGGSGAESGGVGLCCSSILLAANSSFVGNSGPEGGAKNCFVWSATVFRFGVIVPQKLVSLFP